jgi:outer membrane receptor protein involved in Fe transport
MTHTSIIFCAALFAFPAASIGQTEMREPPDQGAAVEPLQEVVITASLRRETALAAPLSVTVIGAEHIEAGGVQHFQDVLGLVPNLNWASGTSRPRYFQLRGIGENDQWQGAPNPSVGFLIDGIDFSGVGMPATMFDVGQVEVLRGPQGAIHGANALAGLINVRSVPPALRSERRIELTGGDYGTASAGVVFGGALGDDGALLDGALNDAAFRIVAQRFRSDGFRRNRFLGRKDTNGYDETTLRTRLAAQAGDWAFDAALLHVDQDNGYDAFALDNSRTTQSDDPGVDAQRSLGGSLRAVWTGSQRLRLESTTAAARSSIDYAFDGDWGFDPGYDFTSRFDRSRDTVSQDLRLLSTADLAQGDSWSWLAGAYALRIAESNDQLDLYNGDVFRTLRSDYRAVNVALYAQVERQLAPQWSLAVAARVEQRDADYRDSDGLVADPTDRMAGGHVSLRRELQHGAAYLAFGRGFKAGGFNIGAVVPADRLLYRPEGLQSVELGWKARSEARGLEWQLALFSMRRTDQQVSTSVQVDPGDPLSFIYLTDNAARGENVGAEAAIMWRPDRSWRVDASVGLLEARFLDYQRDSVNLSGRDQAHAPRWQYAVAAERRFDAGWFLRVDVQGMDRFFFSESHEQVSSPHTLAHLRAGFERGPWRAALWVRNLFDAGYAQRGFFFGNEPPDFPDRLYVQPGDPRQVGVTVNYEWP